MRVLYVLKNFPRIDETYITTEIGFAQKRGIEAHLWAEDGQRPQFEPACMSHLGPLNEAIAAAGPDLVHIHHLSVAKRQLAGIPTGIPITIRGHASDWHPALARELAEHPAVSRVYLFPHFVMAMGGHAKAFSLPVAYDSAMHFQAMTKDHNLVLRLAGGEASQGLDDVLAVANRCPETNFILGVSKAGGGEKFLEHIIGLNRYIQDRVRILVDLPPKMAADLNRRAGIYLATLGGGGHAYGMPISSVEALATGSYVIAPDLPAARAYIGDAGSFYKTPEEAARLIQESRAWSPEMWMAVAERATRRASCFRDDVVLSHLVQDWRSIAGRP